MRDCQPLPPSASGTRHQTSGSSAAFPSAPLNAASLAGLEGSRRSVPAPAHSAHPAHPAFLGTTGGQGNASFHRQPSSREPCTIHTKPRRAKPCQRELEGTAVESCPRACKGSLLPLPRKRAFLTALILPTYFSANSDLASGHSVLFDLSKAINRPPLLSKLACHKCLEPTCTRAWLHAGLLLHPDPFFPLPFFLN